MATDFWQTSGGGNWNGSANWSTGAPPTLEDQAVIALAGSYTVDISTPEEAGSLTITDGGATVADFSTFDLGGMLAISAGEFVLYSGGTISGGTIDAEGSGVFVDSGGTLEDVTIEAGDGGTLVISGGTFENVMYDGTLDVTYPITVISGITFGGSGGVGAAMVAITGTQSPMVISGTATLGGSATIVLAGTGNYEDPETGLDFVDAGSPSTLTIDAGIDITVKAFTNQYGNISDPSHLDTLINSGTFSDTVSGGETLFVGNFANIVNDGAIIAANFEEIFLGAVTITNSGFFEITSYGIVRIDCNDFTNDGDVTISSGTLEIYGNSSAPMSLTTAELATFHASGGGVAFSNATLDLMGETLSTGSGTNIGELGFYGTSISDGTLVVNGGLESQDLTIEDVKVDVQALTNFEKVEFLTSGSDTLSAAAMSGTVDSSYLDAEVETGTLALASAITGSGALIIDANGILEVTSSVASTYAIEFAHSDTSPFGGGTLEIDTTVLPAATISGFEPVEAARFDNIILRDIAYDPGGSAVLTAGNVLEITENGETYDLQFDRKENFANDYFHLTSAAAGGTEVYETTPCYCRGTLILTDVGERAVEDLRIGDRVITKSDVVKPIQWIGRRAYQGRFIHGNPDVLPVCIKSGAIEAGVPRRDLWVSPLHAMFLDGVLVPAIALVDGVSVVQANAVESVEYFHVELAEHDVILAEGAWAESFVDDYSRNMFHNAAEYRVLYPDLPDRPARYCAPRVEDGEELEVIRRGIGVARDELMDGASLSYPARTGAGWRCAENG